MFTKQQRSALVKASLIVLAFACVIPILAHAETSVRYTNANFFTTVSHEQPATFAADGRGGFVGQTVTGRLFRQFPVLTGSNVRLHRFEIDDAFFYISDRGIILADTDLIALSIYQTRA